MKCLINTCRVNERIKECVYIWIKSERKCRWIKIVCSRERPILEKLFFFNPVIFKNIIFFFKAKTKFTKQHHHLCRLLGILKSFGPRSATNPDYWAVYSFFHFYFKSRTLIANYPSNCELRVGKAVSWGLLETLFPQQTMWVVQTWMEQKQTWLGE